MTTGSSQSEENALDGTVAQDLSRFLKVMHQVYGAEKVKYGDTWYTWTANTSDKNPYLNNNESIIKAVVDAAKDNNNWTIDKDKETSKTSIKITVNGMEIEFQVTINGLVTVPVETDN